ncbi:hypothetical protein DFH07DRAFT_991555 [Mycena maculata]|uniref:Uncharacterized protein n=1 Tax=Mycena maculata TaxID=230809 RepID=A0AAD7NSE3_9AGAR|nr:hypothetical protein DFH07DRAFT_991555 [Mycena maculata]
MWITTMSTWKSRMEALPGQEGFWHPVRSAFQCSRGNQNIQAGSSRQAGRGQSRPCRLLATSTADVAVEQMDLWMKATAVFNPHPWSVLGSLGSIYHTHFLSPIAQSKTIPTRSITMLHFLQQTPTRMAADDFVQKLALMMPFFDCLLNDLTRPLFAKLFEEKEVKLVVSLLCNFRQFPGWLEGKADGCVKTLVRLGSTVMVLLADSEEDEYDPPLDDCILDTSRAKRQQKNSAVTGAFDAFCSLSEWQRCFAPGCRGAVAAAELRQCSKSCRRQAWKHPTTSHRELCGLAALLATSSSLPFRSERSADLRSFYQRIDGNEEMEKAAKEFVECFRNLARSLGEGMARISVQSL